MHPAFHVSVPLPPPSPDILRANGPQSACSRIPAARVVWGSRGARGRWFVSCSTRARVDVCGATGRGRSCRGQGTRAHACGSGLTPADGMSLLVLRPAGIRGVVCQHGNTGEDLLCDADSVSCERILRKNPSRYCCSGAATLDFCFF